MLAISTAEAMLEQAKAWQTEGLRVGFVPTMGFLHSGHASLMDTLRPRVDKLLVSIYVNPRQFGPNEDLDRYPRDPEGDAALCAAHGVDAIFSPASLYPPDFDTSVDVNRLTNRLCGADRAGHFEGVTTVVARLFGLTRCNEACFGEKDFQQLMTLRRMVTDLAMPVQVVPSPLIRDVDGLALSSRNVYLSDEHRTQALTLNRSLFALAAAVDAGERRAHVLVAAARASIRADSIDYLELLDAQTLSPIQEVGDRPARALVAARYGATRLIDNVAVGAPLQWT